MEPKICIVTKNFPEHFDIIVSLMETGYLSGIVLQTDTGSIPDGKWFDKFFDYKKQSEHKFFGNKYNNISRIKTITVKETEINTEKTCKFINSLNPAVTIFYDIDIIGNEILSKINCEKWKIHEGYVQKFRGFYCNFHACLENKAQYVCFSLIKFDDVKDEGDIIHQTSGNFGKEDTVTDLSYRCLRKMGYDIPKIIEKLAAGSIIYKKQDGGGRYYPKDAFKEADIQNLCENHSFLSAGLFSAETPDFFKQF